MFAIRHNITHRYRSISLLILGCALLVRMIVPTGWMPSVNASGMTQIILCTGTGLQHAYVDASGNIHDKAPAGGDHKSDQPCNFTGLSTAIAHMPVTAMALPGASAPAIWLPATVHLTIGQGLAAPPPPSTGPPILL